MTQKALEDLCRAALAVPADRQEWVPGGDARSTLSQMQEVATSARFFLPLLRSGDAPDFDEHALRQTRALRASFATIEECVTAARSSLTQLCQAISEVPEERLEDEMVLPFGGGTTMTTADVLMLPYWNMTYHLGQVNQLQLMLGDCEMH